MAVNFQYNYPIVLRLFQGQLLVSAPDFGINYGEKLLGDGVPTPAQIAKVSMTVWSRVEDRLKGLAAQGKPIPAIKRTKEMELFAPENDTVTPAEAARLSGLSASTLVRLANERKIRAKKTPKGHRRYVRADILKLK